MTKDNGCSQSWVGEEKQIPLHTVCLHLSHVLTGSDDAASNMKRQQRAAGKQPGV